MLRLNAAGSFSLRSPSGPPYNASALKVLFLVRGEWARSLGAGVIIINIRAATLSIIYLNNQLVVWSIKCQKMVKNVDHCFPKSKMTSSNVTEKESKKFYFFSLKITQTN